MAEQEGTRRPVAVIAFGGNALLRPQDQVAQVTENYGRPNQRWLDAVPVTKAREMLEQHQFPPGSMGPKIRAAVAFVEATGKEVLITGAEHLKDALAHTSGTTIVADGKEG